MKRLIFLVLVAIMFSFVLSAAFAAQGQTKVILLIAEQNINGPKTGWWASEVDLSATEAAIATKMIEAGYEIVEPAQLDGVIKKDRAFRMVDITQKESMKLGNISKAEYILLGKAVASAGGNVPDSSMRSCFANLTAKLVRVKDSKVIAYLEAAGNSAHMDVITGGKEALVNAAMNLAPKIIAALSKQQPDSK
jgi:hypothetical protein